MSLKFYPFHKTVRVRSSSRKSGFFLTQMNKTVHMPPCQGTSLFVKTVEMFRLTQNVILRHAPFPDFLVKNGQNKWLTSSSKPSIVWLLPATSLLCFICVSIGFHPCIHDLFFFCFVLYCTCFRFLFFFWFLHNACIFPEYSKVLNT